MRRDLAFFYPVPVNVVYNAYVQTAMKKFGKDCKQNPFTTLSFGLNFSFKYNMNGGSCTIHFMPYQNGTAINLRYTIVQAMGARYKAHAQDLNNFAADIIRVKPQSITIEVSHFTNYAASVQQNAIPYPQQAPSQYPPQNAQLYPQQNTQPYPQQNAQPYPQQNVQQIPPQNAQPYQQQPPAVNRPAASAAAVVCANCGKQLDADARFCTACGTPVAQVKATVTCPNCGRPYNEDENFCVKCGTKRPQ